MKHAGGYSYNEEYDLDKCVVCGVKMPNENEPTCSLECEIKREEQEKQREVAPVIDLEYCQLFFVNKTALSMENVEDIQKAGKWLLAYIEELQEENKDLETQLMMMR